MAFFLFNFITVGKNIDNWMTLCWYLKKSIFCVFKFSALNFQIITEYGEQVLEETKKSMHSTPRKKGKNFEKLILSVHLKYSITKRKNIIFKLLEMIFRDTPQIKIFYLFLQT